MNTTPKIESLDLNLGDLLQRFYVVPDFQREYVWKQENVLRLLQDIDDEFYDEYNRIIPDLEYFIGSIVVCSDNEGRYQLIDGQQRMTTIYLVLCALRDYLRDLDTDPPGKLYTYIADIAMDPITGEDIPRFRLDLQYEESDHVLETIAIGDEPVSNIKPRTLSVERILSAYETIRDFLAENFQGDPAEVRKFYAAFTSRVKLIRIVTPNLAHALKIFETINDRGVGLNSMDLLKNLLFMRTLDPDQPKLKTTWQEMIQTIEKKEKPLRFLRYYIMSHYDIDVNKGIREDEIYQFFVENAEHVGINRDPLGFAQHLVDLSAAYSNFIDGKDANGNPNRYLQNIAAISGAARQHFVLLLAARHLEPSLFTELCRHIENLVFTYIITREHSKTYERNFARWAKELRTVKTQADLADFVAGTITAEIASHAAAFEAAIRLLSIKNIQQYRMKYILAKLTQFIEENAWGNPAQSTLGNYTNASVNIEHILPSSPRADVFAAFDKPDEYSVYKSKLGNLTLLEKTINTSISNASYEAKKPGYLQSQYLLTKSLVEKPKVGQNTQLNRAVQDLVQFETWDSEAIDLRQEMLALLARRVWLEPSLPSGVTA